MKRAATRTKRKKAIPAKTLPAVRAKSKSPKAKTRAVVKPKPAPARKSPTKRAVAKRLRLKGKPETREDSKKFYDYLLRQGFSYDLVSKTMREIAARDFDEADSPSIDY